MNADQWARVTALFHDARERPPLDRDAWLRGQCEDDETRGEVLEMLRAYDEDPGFMEQTPDLSAAVARAVSTGLTGRRLGAWRLLAEIGRGGMGVVYEVQRDDQQFDRRAAIKILPASSGAALAERFRFERRVLAGLDHPGIARLIDAGTTPEGLPYFVMELVDGQRIDDWCRARGLGVRERVALVERVGEALAYAHQHLVIHRDVKPANILVTDEGQPKLLDFGIATMLMAEGEASAGMTRTGQHSFTPEYASPEQVRGDPVTTATDVYSLGVVLYQLLAEHPPYVIKGLSPLEAMRTVCDVEPHLMSVVAAPDRRARLRGDLDAIVAKTLAKAPHERYGTIAELTADLRAWRAGRPVRAAPQSVTYRARRFVRRHRGGVAAVSAVALALVAGVTATAWQARVAARERDKAQHRFHQVQEFSRSLLFDVHNALRPVPGATEARRLLLDRAVRLLDGLAADAGTDDALKVELAEGYRRLGVVQGTPGTENVGDLAAATVSFEKAVALVEEVMRADPSALDRIRLAINVYSSQTSVSSARGQTDTAAHAHQRHLALVQELDRRHPADVPLVLAVANGYSDVGIYRAGKRDFAGARDVYAHAVRIYEALPADARADRSTVRAHALTLKRLGAVEMVSGALANSERYYRAALAMEEDVLGRHPDDAAWRFELSYTMSDLGMALNRRGQRDEALTLWTRALAVRRAAFETDPKNARAITALASILRRLQLTYRDARRYPEALAASREDLQLRHTLLALPGRSPGHVMEQAWATLCLADLLLDMAGAADARTAGREARARVDEARALFQSIRPEAVKTPGTADPEPAFRAAYDKLAGRLQQARPSAPRATSVSAGSS